MSEPPGIETHRRLCEALGWVVDAYDREREVARIFQRAALPTVMPQIAGLRFDAYYAPATSRRLVGGDWYDVFRLADGLIVFSIGDVMGHGMHAAATMSHVKQALRVAALVTSQPAEMLALAHRTLELDDEQERLATAIAAIIEPDSRRLTYAIAGHPAPLIRSRAGTVRELPSRPGVPLGAERCRYETSTITFEEGDLFVAYTDGLLDEDHDTAEGERLLRSALSDPDVSADAHPAQRIAHAVLSARVDEEHLPHDDVAVVTIAIGALERRDDLRARLAEIG